MRRTREWDKFWVDRTSGFQEPKSKVEELVPLLRRRKAVTVLDLGCGRGRHVIYLAKKGFVPIGQDISGEGLEMASDALEKEGIRNYVLLNHDVTRLPFCDNSIDAAISTSALHHNRIRDINKAVDELHRVLRRSGILFVDLTARQEHVAGGRQIEKGTYVTKSGPEKGIIHHMFTEPEIRSTFSKFRILRLTPPTEKEPSWNLLAEKRE